MVSNLNLVKVIAVSLLLFAGIIHAQHLNNERFFTVAGTSMQPSLQPHDQVKLIKLSNEQLQPGDFIAIMFNTRKQLMVKRLIAKVGDKVKFNQGQLLINNKPLDTDWWSEDKRLNPEQYRMLALQLARYENHIPDKNIMVMGDGISSFDSGDYGLISYSQIVGKIEKQIEVER